MIEERYVLGIAYAPGKDPRIKKGADGFRDWFTAEELEKASRTFMKALDSGIMHVDGTLGHVEVTESYIYRGPDWDCNGTIVKAGTWLVGGILDEPTWELVKQGKLNGWSMQGSGRRVRSTQ